MGDAPRPHGVGRMGLSASVDVLHAIDYLPFGGPRILSAGSEGATRPGYTGKEHDPESRLTYFGARYLDPELGTWTSVDPLGQYHSPYAFVGGSVRVGLEFIEAWNGG